MARKTRIHFPGGLYHVLLNGNPGQNIFDDEEDIGYLDSLIGEGVRRYGYRIHAFCWMKSQMHFAIQVDTVSLARIMQNLSFRFTRRMNNKRKQNGQLFRGRYKALLLDKDSYLLPLVRHLHLHPVRDGLVKDPKKYPWSSHRAYLGVSDLPWLTTGEVLQQFAGRPLTQRRRYERYVTVDQDQGEDFQRGGEDSRVLADSKFLKKVINGYRRNERRQLDVKLQDIIEYVSNQFEVSTKDLCGESRNRYLSEARALIGWLARQTEAATTRDVALYFNRDATTLSRLVGRIEIDAAEGAKKLKRHLHALTRN